ncbi:TetR/AcrR family transcriptional regulator [Actinomadura oligospora]|uniref:TetR/AcrR family transcriptional regulator n=1 Tax=Actinomadura oligospora TaxID=111804 RepID=UPI00047C8291|nr:TetR/AcrR family transcriptional regulator [Actinomadura oligospora]
MTMDASPLAGLLEAAPTPDDLDTRILDAALAEFTTYGLRRVSVEDVARRAGVARTTIYRRFTNKELLLQAVNLREVRRFLTAISSATESRPNAVDAVVEGFVVGLATARANPLITRVLQSDPEVFVRQLGMNGGAVLLAARDILAARLRRALPAADPSEIATASEVMLRVAVSMLLMPDGGIALEDEADIRAFARVHLTRLLPG